MVKDKVRRNDRQLAGELERVLNALKAIPGAVTKAANRDQGARMAVRAALIPREDVHGQERLIGTSDLVGIEFLHRALRASQSICRIRIHDGRGNNEFGTGFLVAPNLLLTNHHVLSSADTAQFAQAEFDVEIDPNFVPKTTRTFALAPAEIFYSDPDLDFAFVAVVPTSQDGTPLSIYGWLPLIALSGKALHGEWVSIIQHPNGGLKQIVLRENRIVVLPKEQHFAGIDHFLHYTADTERGSSGSPVLNDQFDVIALHHRGVPRQTKDGRVFLRVKKGFWQEGMPDSDKDWIANEGVRISSICNALDEAAGTAIDAQKVLRRLQLIPANRFSSLPESATRSRPEDTAPEGSELEATSFTNRRGYDPAFLGVLRVPLPKLKRPAAADAPAVRGGGNVLLYTHFSVVMSKSRRLARYTAVNIDGARRKAPTKDASWRTDPRIDKEIQTDNELYKSGPDEVVDLQRGHLVRRLDPAWGASQKEVDQGVADTFHYTNAAPHAAAFNDQVWGNLEDYILERAETKRRKVTVFTGPVFVPTDRMYGHRRPGGPYQIPTSYWKVVFFVKPGDEPAATAFILDQSTHISDLFERFTPMPEAKLRRAQVPLAHIEELAGLDFGTLKQHDRFALIEATSVVREIRSLADIVL